MRLANHKLRQLKSHQQRYRAQIRLLDERLHHEQASLGRLETQVRSIEGFLRAVGAGDLKCVQQHLDRGADPNARTAEGEPALLVAASRPGNLEVVRALLRAGARVDLTDNEGSTALIACVTDEQLPIIEELIQSGADVNARNAEGDTPLTNAAAWGSIKAMTVLLDNGADPNAPDGMGLTAVQLAKQQGHHRIAALLAGRGGPLRSR